MIARIALFALCVLSANIVLPGPALTQSYPNRPTTMIVPFAPGGPSDAIARQVAKAIEGDIRQSVAVENVVGGSGAVGAAKFERATADGYTFLFWVSSANALRSIRATPVATVAVQGNVVYGIVVPVGTPDGAVTRLNSAVNKALAKSAELKAILNTVGAEPKASTPKEAAALIGTAK